MYPIAIRQPEEYNPYLQAKWYDLRAHVERKQSALVRLVDHVDTVYDMLTRQHEDLRKRLLDVRRDLRARERGVPRDEVAEQEIVQPALNKDEATKYMCRKVFRALAPLLHPDRGGDAVQFHQAVVARRMNDLDTLNVMYRQRTDYNDIWWRQKDGIANLKGRLEVILVRQPRVESTPQYRAVCRWLYGGHNGKKEALSIAESTLRGEIANTLNMLYGLEKAASSK